MSKSDREHGIIMEAQELRAALHTLEKAGAITLALDLATKLRGGMASSEALSDRQDGGLREATGDNMQQPTCKQ